MKLPDKMSMGVEIHRCDECEHYQLTEQLRKENTILRTRIENLKKLLDDKCDRCIQTQNDFKE